LKPVLLPLVALAADVDAPVVNEPQDVAPPELNDADKTAVLAANAERFYGLAVGVAAV